MKTKQKEPVEVYEPEVIRRLRFILHKMTEDYNAFCEKQDGIIEAMEAQAKDNEDDYVLNEKIPPRKERVKELKAQKKQNLKELERVIEIMDVLECDSMGLRKKIKIYCELFEQNILYKGQMPKDFLDVQLKMMHELYRAMKLIDNETEEIRQRNTDQMKLLKGDLYFHDKQ